MNNLFSEMPVERGYQSIVLVCMGDSLVSINDWQAPEFTNWVSLVRSHTGMRTINAGISGQTTAQMLARFQKDVISQNPTYCTILGGGNDVFYKAPLAETKNNIVAMVELCATNGIIPILMTSIPEWDFAWRFTDGPDAGEDTSDKNLYPEQSGELPELRRWIEEYHRSTLVKMIDLYNTDLLMGETSNDLSYYYYDREHMNAKGNALIAKKVIDFFKVNYLR